MYETELMREILKSPMAQKMIQNIAPRYGNAYVFLWLMQVTGIEWDEMEQWIEEFKAQVVPQTATWSLPWWEERYKIVPDPSWSIEQRRQRIVLKRQSKGPMNPSRLANIASVAAGFPVRLVENTGKNRFTIYISATPDLVNEQAVREAIEAVAPARLICDIEYEQAVIGTIYTGGMLRYKRTITLQQIN